MKKLLLIVVILFSFVSCQDEVSFNNPSLQGLKDNVFWRSVYSKATLETNGSLTIKAFTGSEILTLKTSSTKLQTYYLGTSTTNMVEYVLTDGTTKVTFSTGFGIGDGQIVITEYDVINNTISGTFKFNAVNTLNNPLAGPVLNFQQAVFYKVPVGSPTL